MAASEPNESKEEVIGKVKVAAIQASSLFGDIDANTASFSKHVAIAAENGAKFIVLPEASISGYASQDFEQSWCLPNRCDQKYFKQNRFKPNDPSNVALPKELDSNQMLQHFCKLCKKLKVYLTVPFIEKAKNNKEKPNDEEAKDVEKHPFPWNDYLYFNSVSLIDPNGNIVGHYRKTHLWPDYDNAWATVGDEIVTVDTEYGKVGLGICFDVHKILRMFILFMFYSFLAVFG